MSTTTQKHWTKQQVADLLAVSVQTVGRLIKNDDLKAIRIGRQVRIPEESVLTYLARKGVSR